jgi:cysteine-rich repeat protein
MTVLRALPLALAAFGLGCNTRALDPNQTSGGGGVTLTGTGGATADGGVSADAIADAAPPLRDALPIEFFKEHACGDGVLDPGEQCDDGNNSSGDGCTALCQIVCGWTCTCVPGAPCWCVPGGTCIIGGICGDGLLGANEVCDDSNAMAGDGCSADCQTVEPGWRCPVPGRRCVPVCGDGIVVVPESCDDGNTVAGDGCSATCSAEPTTNRCGDGVVEGSEACDDGAANSDGAYGDGCTTQCQFPAYCGDGIVNGPEECDLGVRQNTSLYGNPDGCTPGCTRPHFCGDGIVDYSNGENCDLGAANGQSYCTTNCKILI